MSDRRRGLAGYANLSRMAFGYQSSQILYAAVRLGLPDLLAEGAVPVTRLAESTGSDPYAWAGCCAHWRCWAWRKRGSPGASR
ncbi:methyltransferase family protein [Microbispora sp. CA-102843]|uniref:methyltransferase family protein n=1 Tax=Microbispora sp. CA-102843 TaxID=3239952 RepID=UPI003D914A8B